MKFTEKFPDLVDPTKRFPEKMLGPHPEVICGPGLAQTWRMYPCGACKVVTGFRLELGDDFPMVPCCSEECAVTLKAERPEQPAVTGDACEVQSCGCNTPLPPIDLPSDQGFDEMFLTSKPAESQILPDPAKNSTEGS